MRRWSLNIEDDTLAGIRSCAKAEKVSMDRIVQSALCAYLQGFEVLIVGPDLKVTMHHSHREALLQMAGVTDWYTSKDLENRSFEGKDGAWARIVRVEVPR